MTAPVFISYRRADTDGHAGRLFDRLTQWFDEDAIFFDKDSIEAGDVFPERLKQALASARCVLVLIGPTWVAELNRRLAASQSDFVRLEVEAALQRLKQGEPVKVMPVLLGGAEMPSLKDFAEPLREPLGALAGLDAHGFQGKNDDWNHQFMRLRELLEAVPGMPKARYRQPAGVAPQAFQANGQSVSPCFHDPLDALGELQRLLAGPQPNAEVATVAITGMGGVGKTQLALKYSHLFRDVYAGVWWFRAEAQTPLQLDAMQACEQRGVMVRPGELPMAAFKRWLDSARGGPPWLLVFDNAEDPAAVRACLPEHGGHHVLITSRNPAWSGLARVLAPRSWTAEQGAAFMAQRLVHHPDAKQASALNDLAEALGGLPLALEQAAAFLDDTGMAVLDYLAQLRDVKAAPQILQEGRAATGYERSVLATLALAFPRLAPDAAMLMRLLAFCSPAPVPESLFLAHPEQLPAVLAEPARNAVAWEKLLGALRRLGLLERTADTSVGQTSVRALTAHRLTQEVVRAELADAEADAGSVLRGLCAALPPDPEAPASWSAFARLAPHVASMGRMSAHLVLEPVALVSALHGVGNYLRCALGNLGAAQELFDRALTVAQDKLGASHGLTLIARSNQALLMAELGDVRGARRAQAQLLRQCRQTWGDTHDTSLLVMSNLAGTLLTQGKRRSARALQAHVLRARQQQLGERHADTLAAMNNLATTLKDMGDIEDARDLFEHLLPLCEHVLGPDHLHTLATMNNLGATLQAMREPKAAQAMLVPGLARMRQVLGGRHAYTLYAIANLGETRHALKDYAGARTLQEESLRGMRQLWGDAHPNTLTAMNNLAATIQALGDWEQARQLYQAVFDGRRRVLGEDHRATLTAMGSVAWAQARCADKAGAIELMAKAVTRMAQVLGKQDPLTLSAAQAFGVMRQAVQGAGF